MAESNGAQAGGSNRDATRSRPKVQQLRPTNKDVPPPAPAAPISPQVTTTSAPIEAVETVKATAPVINKITPRIVTGQGSGSTILVNNCQRGNPILQHIRNIGWEYGDIVPDYQVGVSSGALFLSLRYHRLHPEYIHSRIQKLGNMYTLRIMLVMCDVDQHQSAIKELTKICLINNFTLMIAWTAEEAGAYIERYKSFEHKAPDLIKERVDDDYMSRLNNALTNIKGVNKTDVITLATNFGSFKRISQASGEELSQCPGFGATKVKRIRDVFNQPFRVGETRLGRERRAEREKLYGKKNVTTDGATEGAPRGRFIDEDEEEILVKEIEAESERQRKAPAADPASYVTAKSNGNVTNGKANGKAVDVDVEEDVEDADEWDIMEQMTEEERLQLAIEMSKTAELDEEDDL